MTSEVKIKNALLPTGWAEDVAVEINEHGSIESIKVGVVGAKSGALVPGLANLHSHAHQRAMAGLAERSGTDKDSFWTWRNTMYQFVDAIQPHHLHAIAAQLYLELLTAGYTRVAEFQYLHHQQRGRRYENKAEMSLQTLDAAELVGIGITSLPVHYQFGGFAEAPISDQQARFFNEPESFLEIVSAVASACSETKNANWGIAGHSLRATSKKSFTMILDELNGSNIPIHLHIAEQFREVEECVAWCGARPVDYCTTNFDVGENWCLVHATHMTDSETVCLANTGAVAGICPTTEANLGDGFFNAADYLRSGGKVGIGSDSHVSTSPTEELRWFEYGQRLLNSSRNELSGGAEKSTGRHLFNLVAEGGAQACRHNSGAIEVGNQADLLVLDTSHPLLVGRDGDELLDSWIFSGNSNAVKHVYVCGERVIRNGEHRLQHQINQNFSKTMLELRESI